MNANPELALLRCTPADYGAVAEIYNEYIRGGRSTMEETEKTAADIAGWVDHFHEREELWVLRKNGEICGWGIIKRYSDREGYRFTCETAVYLRSQDRSKGYGTYLKKHLIERCRALRYHHLVAKIFAANTHSIEYNRKLGYEIVGAQKEIGWKNGQWVDVVIMQLLLVER